MRNLRNSFVLLLFWMVFFFNIERLNIVGNNTINLASIVYIIGAAIMTIGVIPFVQRVSLEVFLAVTAACYLLIMGIAKSGAYTGLQLYFTLTGMIFVIGTALLSYRLGRGLNQLQQTIELVTMDSVGGRLHGLEESQDRLLVELDHSLRTERPVSLIMVSVETGQNKQHDDHFLHEMQRSLIQRYVLTATARGIMRHLRKTNLVVADLHPSRLLIVAPETNPDEAQALSNRIQSVVQERFEMVPQTGIATMPHDALTFEDLRGVAEQNLRKGQEVPSHLVNRRYHLEIQDSGKRSVTAEGKVR